MKSRRSSHRTKTSPIASSTAKRQRESLPAGEVATVEHSISNSMTPIVEVEDEHAHLRYKEPKPHVSWSYTDSDFPTYVTRFVYVLRPKTATKKTEPPPPAKGIMLPVDSPGESLQMYDPATSMTRQTTEAIDREVVKEHSVPERRQRTLAAQEASLQNWSKALHSWSAIREHMLKKTGRERGNLLADRKLALPPIENHQDESLGPDSDFPQSRQKQRFFNSDAFFLLPEHVGPEDDSLVFTLPWSQRKLYKPPVSIIRPDLDEQPNFQNVSGKTAQTSWAEQDLRNLKVTAQQLTKRDSFNINALSESHVYDSHQQHHRPSNGLYCRGKRWSAPFIPEACGTRLDSPYYVRSTVPAFMLDRFTYVWGQPCLQGIVEVGVVSDAGEQGLTYIQLANSGCCVMRYSWRQLPHQDHFNTGRYRRSPFIFNSAQGSLLPEEKLSLPVQFFSKYAGCWTEQWMLMTTPCVYRGNGGREEIALSLWGQALEVDVHLTHRQQLDKELMDSAALRMAQRYAWDLVRLLPIRSSQQQVREQPVSPPLLELTAAASDPVAAFEHLNPGLHYHSAAMDHLISARHDLLNESRLAAERAELLKAAVSEAAAVAPDGCKTCYSSSGFNKDKAVRSGRQRDKSPKVRRVSQMSSQGSIIPNQVRSRQRSVGRQPKTSGSTTTLTSSSMLFDDHKTVRTPVFIGQVHREAYALDEDSEKKEEILHSFNQAALLMSHTPFTPPMRHHKHLTVRAALVQLCDTLAALERKLCWDLGLLDDPSFEKLSTFPEFPPYYGLNKEHKKMSMLKDPSKDKKKLGVAPVSRKISTKDKQASLPLMLDEVAPIDWTAERPAQYHEKLTAMVHGLLSSTLESLLPLLTADGYRLDLLQPPPDM
ncbi:hypothetical protein ACOMHN_007483 [Nucella lapillus]